MVPRQRGNSPSSRHHWFGWPLFRLRALSRDASSRRRERAKATAAPQCSVAMATLLRTNPPGPAAVAPPKKNQRRLVATLSAKPSPNHVFSGLPIHFAQRRNGRSRSPPVAAAVSGSPETITSEGFASLLEGVEVFDLAGRPIPILDLWKDRKTVVGFARHFGCVLCRKRADLLASKKDLMDAAGVALVLIGPGTVEQAKTFFEQTNFKGEVYADPEHLSFNALNFVSGVSTTFTPLAGLKIIQSYMEGYRQDWGLSFKKHTVTKGGWQQGGILVAGPGKSNVSYFHKDKEAGDDPDIEDIITVCCSE